MGGGEMHFKNTKALITKGDLHFGGTLQGVLPTLRPQPVGEYLGRGKDLSSRTLILDLRSEILEI